MNLLVFAIVVLVVAALFFYAVDQIEQLQAPFKGLIKALILIIAAVAIMIRAGII